MSNLSNREKRQFESLFNMESGYVLDFTNPSFSRFIIDSIGLDIYSDAGYTEYCSKANKLRQIWKDESDYRVGTLMNDLLDYYVDERVKNKQEIDSTEERLLGDLYEVTRRLLNSSIEVALPIKTEETLKVLLEDIQDSLSKNKPALVLDRLHTFSVKFLRQLCFKYNIEIEDKSSNKIALHGLAGKLKKHYESTNLINSKFALLAIQNSISLFDSFNEIRNEKSYAHDNKVLENIEAEFVVRAMANVLTFLDAIEEKAMTNTPIQESDFELPF